MIERTQLKAFEQKFCKLILNNGFSYIGVIVEVKENSILFDDRFDGLTVFDIAYIKAIGEARGGRNE